MADRYVLRDLDRQEIDRLRLQHEVWREPTDEALAMASFGRGDALADLGCGPGFLATELAHRVGPEGRVLAIDASELFIGHLRHRCAQAGLDWIEPRCADLSHGLAEAGPLDGAVCRWVLMFVQDPPSVLERVARALEPGGAFLALEYCRFGEMSLHPRGSAFARTYRAVADLISAAGGDVGVGDRLPSLLERAGLEVVEQRVVERIGHPGDPLWSWLDATNANHANLVDAGLLTREELDEYYAEWDRAASTPGAYFTAPPLLLTLARKRSPTSSPGR